MSIVGCRLPAVKSIAFIWSIALRVSDCATDLLSDARFFFAMPCRWRSAPEHQSRLRRKTVFDGARRGLAVGLVNKFPVRLQRPAVVLRTFRLAGH